MTFGKRILSLVLPSLIVITSLPVFAVTANASITDTTSFSSNLVARYLVDDLSQDECSGSYPLKMEGNVSWQENQYNGHGAANFTQGNYLYTSEAKQFLSSASISSGLTVSFLANANNNDNNPRFFEFNDRGLSGIVDWNGGATYYRNQVAYLSMWPNTKIEVRCYDGDNIDASSSDYTDFGNWHQYTVSVSAGYGDNEVTITTYRNGIQISQFTSTKYKDVREYLYSCSYLLIGSGCWKGDDTYEGLMRDFRVYDKGLTSPEVTELYSQYQKDNDTTLDYTFDDLKSLIQECETKFESLGNATRYRNMKGAYEAYVAASKLYDSYYYGNNTAIPVDEISDCAKNLDLALNQMSEAAPYVGTKVPLYDINVSYTNRVNGWVGGFGNGAKGLNMKNNIGTGIENVLYAPDGNAIQTDYLAGGNVYVNLYANSNPVLLYDGINNPKLPIVVKADRDTKNNRNAFYAAPTDTSNWKMVSDKWFGTAWNPDWEYLFYNGYVSGTISKTMSGIYGNTQESYNLPNNDAYHFHANSYEYIGEPKNTGNEYPVQWDVLTGDDPTDHTNANITVRVINYEKLCLAINTAFEKFFANGVDVSKYKEGGLSTILEVIDNATGLNPNTYFDNNVDGYVACVSAIDSAIDSLNSASNPTKDVLGYQEARGVLDDYDTLNSTGGFTGYTTDSYEDYIAIISRCRQYMAGVHSSGYTQDTGSKLYDLADAADNVLNPTMADLNLAGAMQYAQSLDIFEDGVQKYTLASWKNAQDVIQAAFAAAEDHPSIGGVYEVQEVTVDGIIYNRINKAIEVADILIGHRDKLKNLSLVEIDTTAFDAAYEVATTVQKQVYNKSAYNNAIGAFNVAKDTVYNLTPEQAYTQYGYDISKVPADVEKLIGAISMDEIDTQTKAVIDALNTLEMDSNRAEYNVTITNVEPKTCKYGEQVELPAQSNPGKWTISYGAEESTIIKVPAGEAAVVTVESNMNAIFEASVEGDQSTQMNKVNVYDSFGRKVVMIYYTDIVPTSENIGNVNVKYTEIPFYQFKNWKVETVGDNEYNIKPVYDYKNKEETFIITANGEELGEYTYDQKVTLTTKSNNFYAWVKLVNGSYQIVSYDPNYVVYACVDADYYTITNSADGKYRLENNDDVILDSSNVQDIMPANGQSTGMTADDYLKYKLDNKLPFVNIETTYVFDDYTKYRVYASYTYGANQDVKAYGVNIELNGKTFKFNCSNKTAYNQFMLTLTLTSAYYDEVVMKPYINYTFNYSGVDINAIDQVSVTLNEQN